MQVAAVGLDIAKHVFQLHGIDTNGESCSAAEASPPGGASILR
jgi:hypothetical protein